MVTVKIIGDGWLDVDYKRLSPQGQSLWRRKCYASIHEGWLNYSIRLDIDVTICDFADLVILNYERQEEFETCQGIQQTMLQYAERMICD